MFKELFVVLSAKISGFINGIKQVLGVTQGARQQINSAARDMGNAFESVFSGDLRSNIANLSESISVNRDRIIALKQELKELQAEQKKQKAGTEEFKRTEAEIRKVQKALFDTTQDLAQFNVAARDQKRALAQSRLAAEDNSAAIEATSRAVNAATGALLLMSEGNESLKPAIKAVSVVMAGVNAIIAIQNLTLRENAVFLGIVSKAQNVLKAAVASSTLALAAFKAALIATGIGAVIVGLYALYEAATQYNKALDDQIDKELELAKIRDKEGLDSLALQEKAFKKATEIKLLQAEKEGKSQFELANLEISLLKERLTALRLFSVSNKVTQAERAKAIEMYNDLSDDIYKKELKRDIDLIKSSKKVTASVKEKLTKFKPGDTKQATNNQAELLKKDELIARERELLLATSEEEKAKIINASEQNLLNIREATFLQSLNAEKANNTKSNESFKQLELDKILFVETANKRLLEARTKDFNEEVKIFEDKQREIKDSQDYTLEIYKEYYEKLKGIEAKSYNDGEISLKTYKSNIEKITRKSLDKRLQILKDFGRSTAAVELEIANMSVETTEAAEKEKEELIKRTNRAIERALRQLGNDIGNALSDSLNRAFQGTGELAQIELDILKEQQRQLEQTMKDASQSELQMLQNRRQYLENEAKLAEATESNLSKLFGSILTAVADFLQQLGVGLVAAAVATDAFKELLLTNPKAAAVAGAAAIVASAGVRAVLARGVKFADGGIVSGPTLGLVGEYPGASTNPEVIAPLNKLKSLIGDTGGGTAFIAETRISGRDLAIVFNRYNKDLQRG